MENILVNVNSVSQPRLVYIYSVLWWENEREGTPEVILFLCNYYTTNSLSSFLIAFRFLLVLPFLLPLFSVSLRFPCPPSHYNYHIPIISFLHFHAYSFVIAVILFPFLSFIILFLLFFVSFTAFWRAPFIMLFVFLSFSSLTPFLCLIIFFFSLRCSYSPPLCLLLSFSFCGWLS